ncbi:MAG: TIGR00289 family protein [Thermoplasmata archaeon]
MRLAGLFSGGKDSTLSIHLAGEEGHEVSALVTLASKNPESYMFHVANIHLAPLQAEAMGLPIIYRETEGEREAELGDLREALREAVERYRIEGVLSGAVASSYQKRRIDRISSELGLASLSPLWGSEARELLAEMVRRKFKVIVSAVAAEGLGPGWLGRQLDVSAIEELGELSERHRFSLAGEGGEFETLVLDAPMFKKRLEILEAEILWSGGSGVYFIKKSRLVDK